MCGLNLIIDKKQALRTTQAITYMNQATLHRGTEASLVIKKQGATQTFFLGHNRLKINDLDDRANQPFFSECQRYVLLFNGEIYNYRSLQKHLAHKYTFRTTSDTEVLLYFLTEFGTTRLHDLEGMFAFVWIDLQQERYFWARDRWGMKPLYYTENDNFCIVSSEIRGILASQLVPKQLNETQIYAYLRFKFADFPQTFFKDIQEVSPIPFPNLAPDSAPHLLHKPQDLITQTEQYLKNSVSLQLQTEVKIGILLSGGVDSTLLLAMAQELGYEKIPTFTLTYIANKTQRHIDDTYYARLAASQYNSLAHEVEITPAHLAELPQFMQQIDQPIADPAAWLTHLICQQAKQNGFKVLLSGAGADELFAGYHRHTAFAFMQKYYFWINKLQKLLPYFIHFLPIIYIVFTKNQYRLTQKWLYHLQQYAPTDFAALTQLYTTSLCPSPLPTSPIKDLKTALQYDITHFLRQDVLKITDNASMQHTIEVRLPYLSNELFSFLNQIPDNQRFKSPKWILKQLLLQKKGKLFVQRPKEGFGFPWGNWLYTTQGRDLTQILYQQNSYIYQFVSYPAAQTLLQTHKQQQKDLSTEIWALTTLAHWLESHFGNS